VRHAAPGDETGLQLLDLRTGSTLAWNLQLARAPSFLHAGARISPGSTLNASRKLGIGWCFAALLASSAGLDWQHPTGIYGGGNVTSVSSGVELDGYAGYTRQVGMFSVDFGASLYDYSDEGYIDGEFREVYVGGQVGPVAVSIYRGRFDDVRYWYGEANAGIPAGPVTLELHYGLADYGFGGNIDDIYAGIVAGWKGFDWRVRLTHREDSEDDVDAVLAISRSWKVGR